MKKFLPYLFSLIIGSVFGYLLFSHNEISIPVMKEEMNVTAFQLGVFNSIDLAKEYVKKYDTAIIMQDGDVYRVYFSILSKEKTISKMRNYLDNQNISYYEKNITISDKGLIKALENYEDTMLEGTFVTLESINKLIMESYGGSV